MKNISNRVIFYRAAIYFKVYLFLAAFIIFGIAYIYGFNGADPIGYIAAKSMTFKVQVVSAIVLSSLVIAWRVAQAQLESTSYNFIVDRLQIRQSGRSKEYFYENISNAEPVQTNNNRIFSTAHIKLNLHDDTKAIIGDVVILYNIDANEASEIIQTLNSKLG